ncbi:MAG: TRAP transporter substrate-binding protein DctP [Rhodospirillales bacterium]|nr:TRAP transporter substrate-binding protein DctP [Rhodospirillales bacterium]
MMIRLLALLAALALAAFPALAAPAQIFLAHAQRQDPSSDTAAAVADEFRRQLRELSDGRMTVEIFADGILGGNRDTAALVEKGVIHSALVTVGGVTPIHPPLGVTQIPFAFDRLETAQAVLDGPFGDRLAEDMAARTHLRLLGFVNPTGFHILTNSNRDIHTPEQMQGLRIRAIPGAKALEAMIRSVGAVPVKVSSREELSALSTGAVDGQMNPVSVVLARGIDGLQRHATLTNHLYVPFVWVFNKQALEAMPLADVEIITKASRAALAKGWSLAEALHRSERGLAGLGKRLQVHELTAAERTSFQAIMRPPVEEAIAKEIGSDGNEWIMAFKAEIQKHSRPPTP